MLEHRSNRGEADSAQRQLFLPWLLLTSSLRRRKEKRSFSSLPPRVNHTFIPERDASHLFSLSLTNSPSFSRVRHGFDSSSVHLLMMLILPVPIPSPVLPFSLRLIWSRREVPWDASNTAVIFQYPQRIQNSLSSVLLSLPHFFSSLVLPSPGH